MQLLFLDREVAENLDAREDRTSAVRAGLQNLMLGRMKSPNSPDGRASQNQNQNRDTNREREQGQHHQIHRARRTRYPQLQERLAL